jgi:hypothetical protein
MRSILTLALFAFAFSFCGLQERFKNMSSNSAANSNTSAPRAPGSDSNSAPKGEPAQPTAAQKAIIDGGTETKWDAQGLAWKLPAGWKKMDVSKETFNYQSPDNAFLLVNISSLPSSFPMDTSLQAYYDQAMEQLKNGKYESVKMVEIDGIPGVEFVESPPEDRSGVRRHQWIGYRSYLGQNQQLNVMTSTKGSNFDKHGDDFAAILYSMTAVK